MRANAEPGQTQRARRREVTERLARLCAATPSRPLPAGEVEPRMRGLVSALFDLGPVFAAFGRYLGSRPDLLGESEARQLAALADPALPLSAEALEGLVTGLWPEPSPLSYLDPEPARVTWTWQEHRGRLVAGGSVRVSLPRADAESLLVRDLPLLPLLAQVLGSNSELWLEEAVADFAASTRAELDVVAAAVAWRTLGQESGASGLGFTAPALVRELCGRRALVREELAAPRLAAFFVDGAPAEVVALGQRLARELCQVWLAQACFGQVFPLAFEAEDVAVLPGPRLAVTGGDLATLPAASKGQMWEYLVAAGAQDPDRCFAALLPELSGGSPAAEARLLQRLRQLVPFRDGGWGARDDLPAYIFLHFRAAVQEGFRPRPSAVLFLRGLTHLTALARQLAPGGDPLREALESQRIATGLSEVTGLAEGDQLKALLAAYGQAMLALPKRLQEMAALAADGKFEIKLEMVEPPEERRRKDQNTFALAGGLALLAVGLLAHHLLEAGTLGEWANQLAPALLLGLGGFLLFRKRRQR